jgi:hypothetical protein
MDDGVEEQPAKQAAQQAATAYVQADAPIETRADDRLSRSGLAEAIARQVVDGPKGQGFVIGLAGHWGSGKTSVLRMVEEVIGEREDITFLQFNPWLFTGTEELVARFLDELAAQLRGGAPEDASRRKLLKVADGLSEYAAALQPLSWIPIAGTWANRVGKAGEAFQKILKAHKERPSSEQRRRRVQNDLAQLNGRIVVVIDDLDRIEQAQIRDMVRLVKLVGDFPNVTYLLAYDREPIELALGVSDEPMKARERGAAYLEKVVQVVHDLPDPPVEMVQEILLSDLQTIVDHVETGPFASADWQNLYAMGLAGFFRTLRDVRRYLNALPVTLSVIGREVALADVLALEVIRTFVPSAYEQIPAAVSALTAEGTSTYIGADTQERDNRDREQIDGLIAGAGDHSEATGEVLRLLFPVAGHLLGRVPYVGAPDAKGLRVSHPDILKTYLRRALPPGVVSGAVVARAASLLPDGDALDHFLSQLDPHDVERVIARLEDFEDDFEPSFVEGSVPALLNQLPRLREEQRGMFDFGADLVVVRVVLRLIRTMPSIAETVEVVNQILPQVSTLTGRLELIDCVGTRPNVGHDLIGSPESDRLYAQLRDEIRKASWADLARERSLGQLFVRLADDDVDAGVDFIRAAVRDDDVLIALLRSSLSERTTQTIGQVAMVRRPALPWEVFVEWIGEDVLIERVGDLRSRFPEGLPGRAGLALDAAIGYAQGDLSNED